MITLQCRGCRTLGEVTRRTASLRCTCGSTDFIEPGGEDFLSFMGAKRAYQDPPGWNEYEGPKPGPNPSDNHEPNRITCPDCKGSGKNPRDNRNNGECRACRGQGKRVPTTEPKAAPQVARHPGTSTQTKVPFVGARIKLDAPCGLCRHAGVELRADRAEHAWVFCASCGPLVDLDRTPQYNPWTMPITAAQRGFKVGGLRKVKATGRVLGMFRSVVATNPGLSPREVLGLVRRTVIRHSED